MIYAGRTRRRLKLDKNEDLIKRTGDAKAFSFGYYVWVNQEAVQPKGTKKLLKNGAAHFKSLKCTKEVVFIGSVPDGQLITRTSSPTMPHRRTGVFQPTCMMRTI